MDLFDRTNPARRRHAAMLLALARSAESLSAGEMALNGALYGLDPARVQVLTEVDPPLAAQGVAGWRITPHGRAVLADMLGSTEGVLARMPEPPQSG